MKRVCHKPKIIPCRGLYWKKFHEISKAPSLKNVPIFCCHKKSFLAIWAEFVENTPCLVRVFLTWNWLSCCNRGAWVCECSVLLHAGCEAVIRSWPVELRTTQDPFFFLSLPLHRRWQKQGTHFDGQFFVFSCQLNPLVTRCSCEWPCSF